MVAHPSFRLAATMNPGDDFGKRELSPALANRFTSVWVPPLEDLEELGAIVRACLSGEHLCAIAQLPCKGFRVRHLTCRICVSGTCAGSPPLVCIVLLSLIQHNDLLSLFCACHLAKNAGVRLARQHLGAREHVFERSVAIQTVLPAFFPPLLAAVDLQQCVPPPCHEQMPKQGPRTMHPRHQGPRQHALMQVRKPESRWRRGCWTSGASSSRLRRQWPRQCCQ